MGESMKITMFLLLLGIIAAVKAEDPYQFFDWNVTYIQYAPLGVTQQVIAINGQFPGPQIDTITNNNIIINVHNSLDEPLLITWNGVQQRRTSWQDGVLGTNCPIQPGQNWTYQFQVKDQIGSFFYYPSLNLQRAAGGYGGISIYNRAVIPVPFPSPAGDFTVLIGDWYKQNHTALKGVLDAGFNIGYPDGALMNGRSSWGTYLTVDPGRTYRFRISNVGSKLTLNFRIQGHKMVLVETEGSYTQQNQYDSLDIHVGQSYSVLVTMNQPAGDFIMAASSRFSLPVVTVAGTLHYSNSRTSASGFPGGPATGDVNFSFEQARSIRWNLTTGSARPNPQGSYHYGMINITKTITLYNSAPSISGKQRYAVNDVSYVNPDTPLKLADYYNIQGVYTLDGMPMSPSGTNQWLGTSVLSCDYHGFMEIIFQNNENEVQSWHLDGYSFFVVGLGPNAWTTESRKTYNLFDAVARSTTQVYPNSWTAVFVALDNAGIWNLRSQQLSRQYLGQELYIRIRDPEQSVRNEAPIPANVLLCGKAVTRT